ncbi:MAG: hypothetical protein QG574_3732, partial [Cyanobacteriota bacterium erpe_2018_sw_21hr_WHONDRS-SW48-000092_B_bin.40]|nr:hypothetical protein [Cyanobacteriota bacterium erpe_2018_sw_21hr_WHONDRS-SW48-000092_B_bin.40]
RCQAENFVVVSFLARHKLIIDL